MIRTHLTRSGTSFFHKSYWNLHQQTFNIRLPRDIYYEYA